jgi:Kef-type K+ transport system membrane component KefB
MHASGVHTLENLLYFTLLQLIVIVGAARFFGWVARRMGQPRAVGEIVAGLVLGPSLFAALVPGAFDHISKSADGLSVSAPLLRLWLPRIGHVVPAGRDA